MTPAIILFAATYVLMIGGVSGMGAVSVPELAPQSVLTASLPVHYLLRDIKDL